MSRDAHDFNNIEARAVIKFCSCNARRRSKFTPFLKKYYGICTILCHRKNLVAQFKHDDFSTYETPCPGRAKE
jgi:hypothetical protein